MAKKYNITVGERFGKLVIVKELPSSRGHRDVLCQCDCGCLKVVKYYHLKDSKTTSCGCNRPSKIAAARTKHGDNRRGKTTKEYRTWQSMWARCTLPSQSSYKYYGEIGVSVCDRWKLFNNFLADIGRAPSPAHSIDRINPFGNYEPTNCRWASSSEQSANKRKNWNRALAAD